VDAVREAIIGFHLRRVPEMNFRQSPNDRPSVKIDGGLQLRAECFDRNPLRDLLVGDRPQFTSITVPECTFFNAFQQPTWVRTVPSVKSTGGLIWIADAHRGDGNRFVVHAEEKLTAFLELESAIRVFGELS
jgi:hypothetical protein